MLLFIGLQRCDRYPSNVSSFDGEIQVFPYPKRWRGIISIYHSNQFNSIQSFDNFLFYPGTDGMGFADLQRHFHSFDRDHTKVYILFTK